MLIRYRDTEAYRVFFIQVTENTKIVPPKEILDSCCACWLNVLKSDPEGIRVDSKDMRVPTLQLLYPLLSSLAPLIASFGDSCVIIVTQHTKEKNVLVMNRLARIPTLNNKENKSILITCVQGQVSLNYQVFCYHSNLPK